VLFNRRVSPGLSDAPDGAVISPRRDWTAGEAMDMLHHGFSGDNVTMRYA
jgi:hypothetical protein